ncbi:MAG: tyrosine--tRNA ligase [Candidatus Saccharibacteria bacterium]
MENTKLSDELAWRGFKYQTTLKDATELDKDPIKFYLGVDPSAPSMQVGNLSTIMMVRHFIKHGHEAFMLIGGATGMIGDPDGKSEERELKPIEVIEANKKSIVDQYKRVLSNEKFEVVDNYSWFKDVKFLDFLRDVGKHVPMRQMLTRDFVQNRLKEDGAGISYAEFSYAIMQGYDFLTLFKDKGVSLQVCGSDQWGNCIAGVELIRRITGSEANIWSHPLVINKSTGVKFGKSEDGAVWLDENLTSVYQFYQFWLNVDDEGVEDYLKIYTYINRDQLDQLMADFNKDRSSRAAQKYLAYEVTKIVHGQDRADSVKRISEVLFGGRDYKELTGSDFEELGKELVTVNINNNDDLAESIAKAGLANSKGEARRFLESNAIYINGSRIPLGQTTIGQDDAINGYIILRRGKYSQVVVKVT